MKRKVVIPSPIFKGEVAERYVDVPGVQAKPVPHAWHLGQRPGSKSPPSVSGSERKR